MGKEKFTSGLRELGYEPQDSGNDRVIIDYTIQDGKFSGQKIKLGFEIPVNFEIEPPHGPHLSPRLVPTINPSSQNHSERIHESPFGVDWEHLSRPYPNWPKTDRSVRVYMMHIKRLLETL